MSTTVKTGFVGFGEVNTPREFIEPRVAEAVAALQARNVEVFAAPVVSDDPEGLQAAAAVEFLKKHDFDAGTVQNLFPFFFDTKIVPDDPERAMNGKTENNADTEAAGKVFRWVLAITVLMLLTSGVAFLVSRLS